MVTRPLLVTIFGRKTLFFGDETPFRRHFCAEKSLFWRRDLFSSAFWGGKIHFLATTPVLVGILGRETPFFSDETLSRRLFEAEKSLF
ncbi:hypothetical protein NST61_18595 [Caldifermentibacillus hisashii]|uniref:hypothetical protein n=1 Tax=Caldifermentibacillus hisashii TaxID=996558 RepID=UPI0034D7481D